MKKSDKKATILVENTIFTILNLAFLTILVLFILNQGNQDELLEEYYAKQIAFIIDSAKPGMEIQLDMSDAQESAVNNEIPFESVVSVADNTITVKITKEEGYQYSFFNNVELGPLIFTENGMLKFKLISYKNVG